MTLREKLDTVPRALRCWFVVHGVVDWVFAVPLFLFPEALLRALGWTVVDPMAARGHARLCLDGAHRRATSRTAVRHDLRALQHRVDLLAVSSPDGWLTSKDLTPLSWAGGLTVADSRCARVVGARSGARRVPCGRPQRDHDGPL